MFWLFLGMLRKFSSFSVSRRNYVILWLVLGYLLLSITVSTFARLGVTWVKITVDSARAILGTVMGVSGSILGFLVIYLTFAFDGIRRFFGRHSNFIIRRDPAIWILCGFFSWVIVVSLLAFLYVDHPGGWWRCIFNLAVSPLWWVSSRLSLTASSFYTGPIRPKRSNTSLRPLHSEAARPGISQVAEPHRWACARALWLG
jgi:hypothetical protein